MEKSIGSEKSAPYVARNELYERIELAIQKTRGASGFFVVALQIENLAEYRRVRPAPVVTGLMRELFKAVRIAVHPSQYVGMFQDGLACVFDSVPSAQADLIGRRLAGLTQQVIRNGHYNDLTSQWTDILRQFLWPNKPNMLYSRVGWAIYPRDGDSAGPLLQRAVRHITELANR